MRMIAIETSGRVGSVAALECEGDRADILGEIILGEDQRTAQRLAPAIRDLLGSVSWSPTEVELVAVAVGPGSFTGLRIGVTAAKAFAYAVEAQIVGVNTLAVLAAQAPPSNFPLWTVMDAQRRELFAARFVDSDDRDNSLDVDVSIVSQDEWRASVKPGEFVTGPVLQRIATPLPAGVAALDENLWQPMAASVGRVAWRRYSAGHRDDVWKLLPRYYRSSAAEEKAAQRNK
jgi:tRNA threonylcarbamoyladenosine biosynthesis protein TsaB